MREETTVFDIKETEIIFYTNLRKAEEMKEHSRLMGFRVEEDRSRVFRKDAPYDRSRWTLEDLADQTAIVVYRRIKDTRNNQ